MSRRNTKSQAVVESLLDERRQYQEWLDKLAVPGAAGAPSPVVERVRADYLSRLDNVTRQLARHEGELQTALGEAERRRDLAAGQRTARQDALTEAVLRHEVGEFGDEKFAALRAEHAAFLAQLAEEIESADRDIARLEEVLGLIASVLPESAPPPPSVPAAPAVPATPAAPAVSPAAPAAPVAAAPPAAAAAVGKGATPLRGLDELSFLRSVAGGAKSGPAAPVSGPAAAAEAPVSPALGSPPAALAPPPAPPAAEPPAPEPPAAAPRAPEPPAPEPPTPAPRAAPPRAPEPAAPESLESRRAPEPSSELKQEPRPERAPNPRMGDLPLPSPVHHIVPEVPHESKPSTRPSKRAFSAAEAADDVARKTLRCTECGTLNLPTEWYCEKCGAELSAF